MPLEFSPCLTIPTMAPRRLYLERQAAPEGPEYEFVLYTDHSGLFGGPVLFEEAALRVGTRAQLEAALHWRFLPGDLLDHRSSV